MAYEIRFGHINLLIFICSKEKCIVVTFFNVHTVYVSFYIKIISEGTYIIYLLSYSIVYKSLLLRQNLTLYHNGVCYIIVRGLYILYFSHVTQAQNSNYDDGQQPQGTACGIFLNDGYIAIIIVTMWQSFFFFSLDNILNFPSYLKTTDILISVHNVCTCYPTYDYRRFDF